MAVRTNEIGLEKTDYRGRPTTLCQGCGHNSISSQIMSACYEMAIKPESIIKLSGIGCSSKSPATSLAGRMGSTVCTDECRR
jgi:2-oxoglutarate ferredoxin oxidoreductase subunit beta